MARGHYNVAPRYTPGSPAMVDEGLALRVLQQEREAFRAALEGLFGLEEKTKAETIGMDGIVEYRQEDRRCWLIHDLGTDQHFRRPMLTTLLRAGTPVQNEYGSKTGIVHENGRGTVAIRWEDGRFESKVETRTLRLAGAF